MKKMSYEAAMKRLNEIVEALEGGELDLEKSLTLFEEGTGLVKLCNGYLDAAEQKLTALSALETEKGEEA